MADYERVLVPGGTYFFTVVTAHRRRWLATPWGQRALGDAIRSVRADLPFATDAIVILPDHVHAIWTLPDGDDDFSRRWQRIKHRTTARLRREHGFRGRVWQPRFWEHLIRDDDDLHRHLDYIHYNPVKHGLCSLPLEWSASSFHRYVNKGVYAADWGGPVELFEVPE